MCSPHQNAFCSFCQKSLKHTLFHNKREFLWFKIIRMVFPGSLFTLAEFLTIFQIMPFISLTPRAEDRERELNSFPVQWSPLAAQLGNCGQVTLLFICVREAKTKPGWTGERTCQEPATPQCTHKSQSDCKTAVRFKNEENRTLLGNLKTALYPLRCPQEAIPILNSSLGSESGLASCLSLQVDPWGQLV